MLKVDLSAFLPSIICLNLDALRDQVRHSIRCAPSSARNLLVADSPVRNTNFYFGIRGNCLAFTSPCSHDHTEKMTDGDQIEISVWLPRVICVWSSS